jgi:hypothetical protein
MQLLGSGRSAGILLLMAKEVTPDRWDGLAEPPSEVQVTVLRDPAAGRFRERIGHERMITRARAAALLTLAVAAIWGIVAGGLNAHGNAPLRGTDALRQDSGAIGVAAAYGYPSRCLAVTLSASNSTYARADFNHATSCGRYDGSATAIFQRRAGLWRPVLDAINYSCPVGSLPTSVQAELGVCPLSDRRASRHK